MKAEIACARYVLKHKWYVFKYCCKFGVPFRGLLHDWSKFSPSEFFAYTQYFFSGKERTESIGEAFAVAWLKHHNRNAHHWEYWITPKKADDYVCEMPEAFVKEMVADWIGAGLAQGHGLDVLKWYEMNRSKLVLHERTRAQVERLLEAVHEV